MSSKENFIKAVTTAIEQLPEVFDTDAISYFESFKIAKTKERQEITDNGRKILTYMRENKDAKNNRFAAKDIAEGLFTSSRSVSGAARKLLTDGYIEKAAVEAAGDGRQPCIYSITDKGEHFDNR